MEISSRSPLRAPPPQVVCRNLAQICRLATTPDDTTRQILMILRLFTVSSLGIPEQNRDLVGEQLDYSQIEVAINIKICRDHAIGNVIQKVVHRGLKLPSPRRFRHDRQTE
jgi:hypothetical protein